MKKKILIVGGSGKVGSFITPYILEKGYDVRVMDLSTPEHDVEFIKGSVLNPEDISKAILDIDSFIWVVMKSPQGGSVTDQDLTVIKNNYEVNNLGLHNFLWLSQGVGLLSGIYTSTMSVHYRERDYFNNEYDVPLDTPSAYGLSKGFGENICKYFANWFDMNIFAFRITGPRNRDEWIEERKIPRPKINHYKRLYVTDEEDLASAYINGLERLNIGKGWFQPIFIAGDENQQSHNLSTAKRILNWEPETHKKI